MAGVSFDQVSKVYPDGTRAVDEISLSIEDGEFMVLVGPSGCGKTTALRMVAGLEEVTEGVIRIGERVVNHIPSRDRDIAMVFQSYALYPHLSVYENIAFGLRLHKVPKAEVDTRVHEAARILDLEPFLKRKPRALSGGQRQRVAMGRAIVRQPQAFLMDEPLSNLDAKIERANGGLAVVAGSQRIGGGDETLSARPALERYEGRPVGLGIRPEDLDDASLVEGTPGDRRLKGQVELREALGAEIMVHFSVDARPALTEDVRELAEDVAGATDPAVQPSQEEGRTIMVGRFSPRSRVNEGDSVEVAVDTRALHFFDAETGLAVYDEAHQMKGVPA